MKTPSLRQKLIVVSDSLQTVTLAGPDVEALEVLSMPADLALEGSPTLTADGWQLKVRSGARRLKYEAVTIRLRVGGDWMEQKVPSRIFGSKELFLCITTTSNFHWGHSPQRVGEMEERGGAWWDLMGDPLLYHGHAYASSRYMAEGAHKYGLPVTWLIDGNVAKAGASEISQWHFQHGDDVGILPPSYFFKNAINYNTDRPVEDAQAVWNNTRREIQQAMSAQQWFMQPGIGAVDQWVGSLGSRWIEAGRRAGLRGFWGICHDHETCDGSLYHEGAPWEPYRMSAGNFRYPTLDEPGPWAFPWTSRDHCNSFLEYPGASCVYSTDPDDIAGVGILANQPDYFDRILSNHLGSLDQSDFGCLVIHNEDHDAHRVASENFLEQFYARIPKTIVPATLEEVAQWLELRFPLGTHPSQLLESHDPLTCHDIVSDKRVNNPHGAWKIPAHWKSVNGHNPTVLSYYGADARWAAIEGERVPRQYIDYRAKKAFNETGTSPKETMPVLSNWKQSDGQITFTADRVFRQLPLVFWDGPRSRVVLTDIVVGQNTLIAPK